MENFAYKIDDYIQKKLLLYQELVVVLKQEKAFIHDMETDALWASSSRKKKIAAEIERIRSCILFFLDENGVEHGMNIRTFSLGALVRLLPVSPKIKSDLGKTRIAINLKKDELQVIGRENRKYVQEYLGVINGIMANFSEPVPRKRYSYSGAMQPARSGNHLVNAEV